MKLYLGCAKPPFHPQHLQVLGDPNTWVWVDKYIDHSMVQKWDARLLEEVEDKSVKAIYSSHLLEHFPHIEISDILKVWLRKLRPGGQLILNVPDLRWASEQIIRLAEDKPVESQYYNTMNGEHGLLSIIYGSQSHLGEYHKGGFTQGSLVSALKDAGFENINSKRWYDAHDMGVIISTSNRPPKPENIS